MCILIVVVIVALRQVIVKVKVIINITNRPKLIFYKDNIILPSKSIKNLLEKQRQDVNFNDKAQLERI